MKCKHCNKIISQSNINHCIACTYYNLNNTYIFTKEFIEKNFIKNNTLIPLRNIIIPSEYNWCNNASEFIYCLYHNITSQPKCKECNKPVKFRSFTKGYNKFCSPICSAKNNETRKKYKTTCLKKYGTENVFQDKNVKNKIKSTCLKKYGTDYITQSNYFKTKIKDQYYDKYKIFHNTQLHVKNINNMSKEFIEKNFIINGKYDVIRISEYFNISFTYAYRLKQKFNIIAPNSTSHHLLQDEIVNYIKSVYKGNIIIDSRKIISPKELDIYIPEYNFAIEFDGLLFHSEGLSEWDRLNNLSMSNYHLDKTNKCEEKNIQLFHIFENEWLDKTKKEIWLSIINGKFGLHEKIGARKCYIKEVDTKTAKHFIFNNHLQGYAKSSIKIGLFYQDELIMVATFGIPRYNKKYDYELIRLCSKKNITIQGGASKLLKYFKIKYMKGHKKLLSYANRRWSIGNLYSKIGFKKVGNTSPGYFYFKENEYILYPREIFQKHKLKNLLDTYDPNLSTKLNMFINKYRIIYDCGNIIYELE